MLEIPLDPELERHLAAIAARVGEAPAEIARKALFAHLEDLEDCDEDEGRWDERLRRVAKPKPTGEPKG